tara:strand:+ start:55537 stop:56751 length:1215 start_codon:yes stop_codon:yes gene_type:complete
LTLKAWQQVSIEAPGTLTLYGAQSRGHLQVTLVNSSRFALETGPGMAFAFSFKLLNAAGEVLSIESVRTPLSASVAAMGKHTQKITVIIPQLQDASVAAIRVGLLKEGEYWVETLNPHHPATVEVTQADDMPSFDTKLAVASQIWDKANGNGMRWPYSAMMVSHSHKLFYIPVAKCACTSLKSMMVRLAGIDRPEVAVELGVHFVTDRFTTGVQLKDQTIDHAREILASDDYFKFSVIRDPFERIISAYLEKFVYKRHNQRNLMHTRPVISAIQGRADIDLDRGVSFDEFVTFILNQDPFELDPHWRPQHLYLRGVKHISRIFRLENIAQLEQYLLREKGITIKLGHDNKTGRSDTHLQQASSLTAGELDRAGPINPDSFLASGLGDAMRAYYREDFALYDSAV